MTSRPHRKTHGRGQTTPLPPDSPREVGDQTKLDRIIADAENDFVASVSEAFAEGGRFLRGANSRRAVDEPNYRHSRLLRTRRERPRCRAAEKGDELASFQMIELHSIPAS